MNLNIYKVTFLLYQVLIFLNLFVAYLFRQRDCKKKKVSAGGSWLFFISPGRWIGNEQLFKVGLALQNLYSVFKSFYSNICGKPYIQFSKFFIVICVENLIIWVWITLMHRTQVKCKVSMGDVSCYNELCWDWSSIRDCSLCLKYHLIFYFQEFFCLFYQICRWNFVNLQI